MGSDRRQVSRQWRHATAIHPLVLLALFDGGAWLAMRAIVPPVEQAPELRVLSTTTAAGPTLTCARRLNGLNTESNSLDQLHDLADEVCSSTPVRVDSDHGLRGQPSSSQFDCEEEAEANAASGHSNTSSSCTPQPLTCAQKLQRGLADGVCSDPQLQGN